MTRSGHRKPKRTKYTEKRRAIKALHEDVFEDDDFKRQLREVAVKENLPDDVVETVIKDFLTNVVFSLFENWNYEKHISVLGHLSIFVKRRRNKWAALKEKFAQAAKLRKENSNNN